MTPELHCVYQPIVDLTEWVDDSRKSVVGYEALARVSVAGGSSPAAVDMTADDGTAADVADLDRRCRLAALQGALQAGLGTSRALFINVEPASGDFAPLSAAEQVPYEQARRELRVVVEITERSMLHCPAAVLLQVTRARQYGWGVAIDDVGAHPDSLAMLPFIAPDVIKLDLDLVRSVPSPMQARVVTAVMAHVERTGAVLLAEGIETPEHLEQALSFGATLGQGWMFGRPDALEATTASDGAPR